MIGSEIKHECVFPSAYEVAMQSAFERRGRIWIHGSNSPAYKSLLKARKVSGCVEVQATTWRAEVEMMLAQLNTRAEIGIVCGRIKKHRA